MIARSLCALCIIASGAAWAADAPPSLFFTPDEVRRIEPLAAKAAAQRNDRDAVHLEAILYYGPQNWIVWLNGKRWTPATHTPEIQILEVQSEHIRLQTTDAPRDVTLKPHQIFHPARGTITEDRR